MHLWIWPHVSARAVEKWGYGAPFPPGPRLLRGAVPAAQVKSVELLTERALLILLPGPDEQKKEVGRGS